MQLHNVLNKTSPEGLTRYITSQVSWVISDRVFWSESSDLVFNCFALTHDLPLWQTDVLELFLSVHQSNNWLLQGFILEKIHNLCGDTSPYMTDTAASILTLSSYIYRHNVCTHLQPQTHRGDGGGQRERRGQRDWQGRAPAALLSTEELFV